MSSIVDVILVRKEKRKKLEKKKKKKRRRKEVMEEIVFNVTNCPCSLFLLKFQESGLFIRDIYKGGSY